MRIGLALLFTAIICLGSALVAQAQAGAKKVPAPRGWVETQTPSGREITKGNSIIELGHWESLNSQTIEQVLEQRRTDVPSFVVFQSAKKVKPERSIPGAFQITRNVKQGGRNAQSVIYGCPGQQGYARFLRFTFEVTDWGQIISGGKFLQKVCEDEPKGGAAAVHAVTAAESAPTTTPTTTGPKTAPPPTSPALAGSAGQRLQTANARIPSANRPTNAVVVAESRLSGYPALLKIETFMAMQFPNGNWTHCTKWNPVSQSPTQQSIGGKRCELSRSVDSTGPVNGFTPGQTIDVAFGRISASGIDGGIGTSSSTLRGGDLVLTKSGRIAVGSFESLSASSQTSQGGVTTGGGKSNRVIGRYYLDGYTITIETNEGQMLHSYIGWASKKGSQKIDYLYFDDKQYWDRKK